MKPHKPFNGKSQINTEKSDKKEALIEAAMHIERDAYLLKESESGNQGSWQQSPSKQIYDQQNKLALKLRTIALEL